ncbi:hypothetical protein LguiA_031085 [Lonicera macranthoides]
MLNFLRSRSSKAICCSKYLFQSQSPSIFPSQFPPPVFQSSPFRRYLRYDPTPAFELGGNGRFPPPPPAKWGIQVVPPSYAYVMERFGRYKKTLTQGIHFVIPFLDKIECIHSLDEELIALPRETAITKDNISIVDPFLASYRVYNARSAIFELAQTTLRTEVGKVTLDECFDDRNALFEKIKMAINDVSKEWGMQCTAFYITNLDVPPDVGEALELQAEERFWTRALALHAHS